MWEPFRPAVRHADSAVATPLVRAWLAGGVQGPPRYRAGDVLDADRAAWAARLDREPLCAALRDAHRVLDAPPASLAAVERLAAPEAVAVVTGQQPGLLLGPLYTPYKVLSAIAHARKLEAQWRRPVVPIYWCASEDHDYDEVMWATVLDAQGRVATYRPASPTRPRTPLANIPLTDCPLEPLRAWWEASTPSGEAAVAAWRLIAETHAASRGFADWTQRLLLRVLPADAGLVIVDPTWPGLRRLAVSLLERELAAPLAAAGSVVAAGEALQRAGLPVAMHKAANRCSFFLLCDGQREAVTYAGARFRAGGETFTRETLLRVLRDAPERFSASAMLRPVIQDALLPAALTLVGPGELGYLAQLDGVYAAHGVPRPPAALRFSAVLIDPATARTLRKYGLLPDDLAGPLEPLRKRLARAALEPALEAAFARARAAVQTAFDALAQPAREVDPTLVTPLEKQLRSALEVLESAPALVARRMAQRENIVARQLEAAQHSVWPRGEPQERTLSLFHFLTRYGLEWVGELFAAIAAADPDCRHELLL